jgi:hypothetical protein
METGTETDHDVFLFVEVVSKTQPYQQYYSRYSERGAKRSKDASFATVHHVRNLTDFFKVNATPNGDKDCNNML